MALAGAFAWKGWPFALPLWLGLAVWGWTEPPVVLTGRKDASGMATPAGPGEQKALRRWAAAGQLKWRPVTPNADWLPGWLPRASWFAALVAAAVAWSAPVVTEKLRWANAVAAYLATMSAVGVRRRTMVDDDVCPGAKLDTLAEVVRSTPQIAAGALVAGAAAGWAAAMLAPKWDPWAVGPGGPDTVAYQSPEALAGLASFGVRHPAVLVAACAAGGALAVLAVPWVNRALEHWRIVVAGRAEWNPRWQSLKFDPPPFLVDRQQVGPATVDTFFAPSAQGSAAFYQLRAKVEPTIGAGTKVVILETPNESPEGPVPGTLHPLRFEVVSWPTEQFPDCGDPSTPPEVAALWARCAFDWAHDTLGYGRPVLLGIEALHAPDSPTAAWTSSWAWPGGPGLSVVREQTLGDVGGQLGCEALIDHRTDEMFFGVLDPEAETEFATDSNPSYAVRFERLALEDTWTFRWGEALKQATHAPVVEHSTTAEAKLADGTVIYRQVFVTRLGIDPREFATAGQERKIATALQAAPFVTVRGFPLAGQRRGERHPQAVAVFWSKAPIPNSPQLLAPVQRSGPNNANEWVLGGLINDAFDHGRLSRPEVTDAVCLTQPDARAHLWRITVRLHDGVTLSDVRGAAARIRQSLGVEWLRVTPVTDGAMLFCGVRPEVAKLASERRDRQVLIALDWEQAFLDAGVTGQNGLLPQLVASSTLPANEQVQVLDFTLPPGLSATQVSAAIPKLSTATNNTFVELRPGPNAQTVRLLASVDNPLPAKVGFDFDAVDASEMIPFATGVEGTPVEFDQTSSPHVLIAGMTGAGKSVLAQAFLYGAVIRGWDCYLVDPVKGGADFIFAKDRCKAFAQTPFEAAGVMRSIYAEVAARKNLNAKHGAGSIDELPADIRPPRIFLFIDEFTSLMGQALVPKTDDPEMQDEIEALEAENRARNEIGMFVGKIAREARSAGVHLALGTQKLTAKMLDSIPGAGNDLKDLALETRVPVPASDRFPDGWATVGELEVGDLLFAPDGTLTPIIGFSPVRTNSHVYDVTFDDGQTVRAGASHLWTVSTYQSRRAPRRRSAEPPTRKMRWAERMDEIAASTPVGTWATAADLAALISCSKPAVLSWAKTLGIDAMFQAEDGSLHALPRDRRSGHATRVFSVRHAAELLAEPGIDRLRLLDTEWMSARQIATVLDDAPPSRQRASSVGTLLAKHSVESRPGHPNERPADSKKTPRMFLRSDAADKLAAAQPYGDLSRLADYHDQWLPASEIRSLLLGRRATPSEVASMRGALGELGCLSKDPADLAPMFDVVELCRSAAVAFREGAHLDEDGQIAPSRFVQTTEEMFEALSTSGSRSTFAVDLASPVASPAADLPVDPYVLGVWLGDGCKGSGNVVSGNGAGCVDDLGRSDQEHMVRELSDAGYSGHKLACSDILIGTYGLRAKLREMGLLHDKHIPSMYLRASFDQRLALLQGLMDTDGTVSKRGVPSFDQSSLRVVEGFIELAQSLGIKTMVSSWPTRRPDGSLTGSVNYHVTVRSTLPLFRLPRKAERLARLPRTPRAVEYRAIRSITPAPPTKTRCIAVEHDDHLFLVEGFIPTHNTNLARTLLGKASYGDRASALRAPDDAPKLEGDIPKGRGLWEPLSSAAMVVQCWFAPQSELREALVSRVPALDPSLVLDLSQFAPAEREETTGPPPLRPPSSGGRPAPARVPEAAEVVDVDEMELSLDDLDTDDDAELETAEELAGIEITWGAPDDADAAGDGPVQEADDDELVWDLPVVEDLEVLDRPDTPPHLADTVAFIDIDGVVFPMGRPGSEWEDWTPSVRDDENGWVSPTMLSGIRTLDARLAWLTGWGERAEAFAPELGDLPVVEVPGAVEHGWWKIDGALAWLRDHPEVTRVVWFDDELDNDNDGGRSHREVFAELLDGLGIEHLLVCTSSFVGLLPSELAAATRWVERSSGSPTPQPAVDATIDLGDPGWLTEEPAPAPEPVEEDDPFAAPPPPRLADDEDDDDEFAPPPPLRPADTSDEFA